MKKSIFLILVLIIILSIFLTSCGIKDTTGKSTYFGEDKKEDSEALDIKPLQSEPYQLDSGSQAPVPEFSGVGVILAMLIAGAGAFVIYKSKKRK